MFVLYSDVLVCVMYVKQRVDEMDNKMSIPRLMQYIWKKSLVLDERLKNSR